MPSLRTATTQEKANRPGAVGRDAGEQLVFIPGERNALPTLKTEAESERPSRRAFLELFEEQVERTPHAAAVVYPGELLTYAALNAKANRLARLLRKQGVGPETIVALCLERSADLVVGLLGILKAGGAYLPLDIIYPAERIALMLDDAQAPLLLTHRSLLERLPETATRLLCLDEEAECLAFLSAENFAAETTPDNLAYVLYTSGSTGIPKGVQVTNGSLANLLGDMQARLAMTERDTLVAVTTIAFDIATLEMFLPLICGACVAVAPREIVSDAKALIAFIAEVGGTMMQATPATWRLLTETGWQGGAGFKIVSGGEPLTPSLAKSLLRGGTHLWNGYGPTETTIYSTAIKIENADGKIPIGRPLANTMVYLLDERRETVSNGEIGQLYIGGAGVARGYFNRPELTAERFVPDPFSAESQARMYFTGDLARWLPDGNLEFLGRIDHQVKIRGFRIELGEIEAVLGTHPSAREVVVIAREDEPGNPRLVAYFTVKAESDEPPIGALSAELRSRAAERLPDYMIPARFVPLDALPLTPNGKIDRKALPAPDAELPRESPLVPGRNWLENQLIHIWEDALGVTPLGIDDDFLEIGGHSLTAGRIVAAIGQTLGKDLSLASLLEAPTIRRQAEALERMSGAAQWNSLVALKPEGSRPPIFGIHAGLGVALFYRHLARCLNPEQPFYGLQQQGLNGKRTSLTRIEDMARRYIEEIQTVQPHGPYRIIGYCHGGLIAYEIAQQLRRRGEAIELLAAINATTPDYDFTRGRPLPPETPNEATALLPSKAAKLKPGASRGNRLWRRIQNGLDDRYRRLKYHAAVNWERGLCFFTLARGGTIPWERRQIYTKWLNEFALRRYTLAPYPGRLIVIRGEGLYHDPTMGWENRAQGGLTLHQITGRHALVGSIMLEPHVSRVAAILEDALAPGEKAEEAITSKSG